MGNRSQIPRHELIRTPEGWKDQERALVVQLERIHDDIYRRFPQMETLIGNEIDGVNTEISGLKGSHDLGTKSLADIQTAIVALSGSMSNGQQKNIMFATTGATSIFRQTVYIGNLMRIAATRLDVMLYQSMVSDPPIFGRYRDGSWEWKLIDDGRYVGIVAPGATAPQAIAKGQYLIHEGGLYVAKSAIAQGETLTTTNLQLLPGGGMNAVLTLLSPTAYTSPTMSSNVTLVSGGYVKIGRIVILAMRVSTSDSINSICAGLPTPLVASGVADSHAVVELAINSTTPCYVVKNGSVLLSSYVSATPLIISGVYISAN